MSLFKALEKTENYALKQSLDWGISKSLFLIEEVPAILQDDGLILLIVRLAENSGCSNWCMAGGYPSFILNKTNTYEDIDFFFFNCNDSVPYSIKLIYKNHTLNIISLPPVSIPSCLKLMVFSLISNFDLPICMSAIIRYNGEYHGMSINDDGRTKLSNVKIDRIIKYNSRRIKKVFTPQSLAQLTCSVICNGFRKVTNYT